MSTTFLRVWLEPGKSKDIAIVSMSMVTSDQLDVITMRIAGDQVVDLSNIKKNKTMSLNLYSKAGEDGKRSLVSASRIMIKADPPPRGP